MIFNKGLVKTPLARGVIDAEAARARGERDATEAERPKLTPPTRGLNTYFGVSENRGPQI